MEASDYIVKQRSQGPQLQGAHGEGSKEWISMTSLTFLRSLKNVKRFCELCVCLLDRPPKF